jgi:hypothetical protein
VPAYTHDLGVLDGAVGALHHGTPLHFGELVALGAHGEVHGWLQWSVLHEEADDGGGDTSTTTMTDACYADVTPG